MPLAGLSPSDLATFQTGRRAFLQPANVPGGLGPVFTENACAVCHGGPNAAGASGDKLVTRFGRIVNGAYDDMVAFGGPQVQNHGIGRFNGVNFVGEVVPRQATIVAQRRTIPVFGMGLIDNVSDDALHTLAAQQRANNPATAGRVSTVVDPVSGLNRVGKFGWKAQEASLFDFAADALVNELGVTTPVFPNENCPQGNCSLLRVNPARNQPNDLDNATVQQLTAFMALLAPAPTPIGGPGGPGDPKVRAGQLVFLALGCAQCHQPTLRTGPNAVAALHDVTFAPYSDFLLHDMGALGDGIVQNSAGPREMRTAPLWGLHFERSFLHDGRATNPADAITAHDGQGRASRDQFNRLSPPQKDQLMAFLNSL